MQRCPYLTEMKERLLRQATESTASNPEEPLVTSALGASLDSAPYADAEIMDKEVLELNSGGFGSSTAQHRVALVRHGLIDGHNFPKNAKTSLFIIMSFIYAKLLVVICIAYVLSEVVTHNVPLHYYEGFFTYLYGASILFLLYVFCYLLHDNSTGAPPPPPKPPKQSKAAKKAQKKQEKQEKEAAKKQKKSKKDSSQPPPQPPPMPAEESAGAPGGKGGKSGAMFQAAAATGKDVNLNDGSGGDAPATEKLTGLVSLEAGNLEPVLPRKSKTSENDRSHGSFFLRVGAIAFGLGTMIYNGLEFGAFFELPMESPCYQILRGVNPVLQMVFTFMQMYFIFMNSRLNIHKFKVVARFGLMHVVATNLCVWIRTLVLESLKEITTYQIKRGDGYSEDFMILEGMRLLAMRMGAGTSESATAAPGEGQWTPSPPVGAPPGNTLMYTGLHNNSATNSSPTRTTSGAAILSEAVAEGNYSCGRVNIMGTIVQDSAPYLFPFIIEYSLIGAAVVYVMWSHIGWSPRYVLEEEEEEEAALMERRIALGLLAQQSHGGSRRHGGMMPGSRVDCVGASKGLFFGLLLLVASLICLILFFVLIRHPDLGLLAIYLADVSHCGVMALSILAILIGFIRVQSLKFHSGVEEGSQGTLNDILLRVSAFGLFVYAVFSIIAGSLAAYTHEPNLLVMITGILSVVQVVLQLLFIADVGRRRVHLPEHDRSKPGRQVVTFLLICNVTMWVIYTFETQKVEANPVQLDFYGFLAWAIVQRVTLPLCIFHRFHSAVTFAEIWKTTYKAHLD